ncbi:VanZ family protein [Microbacterium sp. NPDC057659]|uniref:VanZ family protein n=1 Tax=Microbacterium sp. NPDC057659 TaxID=3346198 RepID=UPI00366C55B3
MSRRAVTTVLVIGIVFVVALLVLTISPRPLQDRFPVALDEVLRFGRHTLGWTWLDFTALEKIANVLVFIPVGVLTAVLVPLPRWPIALLVGPALSAVIEIVQGLALSHRSATLSDFVLNSLGATIGAAVTLGVRALRRPRQTPSSRLEG